MNPDLGGIRSAPLACLAFGWGGTTATANSLWFAESGGNTVLYDGNAATAEFMITLSGFTGFHAFSNRLNPPPEIAF